MVTGQRIDESLNEVLHETDLLNFRRAICCDLQITKFDQLENARDRSLQDVGLSLTAIRRLRGAMVEKRRQLKRHPERAVRTVIIQADEGQPPELSQPGTSAIVKDQIMLMGNLGQGTFAVVKRAVWKKPSGQKLDVAVKILRDASPLVMEELQREVSSLQKLQHENLIKLHGVVPEANWMVFELCEGGSLLDRLRDQKKPRLLVSTMLDYCQQIAKGMAFLEVKHCVHRDLATRNVLLSSDERIVKICDFGLMRTLEENERLYIMNPQKRVPFAWCPPESLRYRQFSHASDVWAIGVLMWEIFTFGEEPWVGLRGRDVLERIDAGERLQKPKFCSQQVYDLMDLCWKANPDARPKFKMLWGLLKQACFNVAEVREAHPSVQADTLELCIGDRVHIIENTGVVWFGQNERSRLFGTFLRSAVFVRSANENRHEGNSRISRPIAGSFIHTGHGDARGGNSWGAPETIDEIYLRNPVLGKPHSSERPTIVESILQPPKSKPDLPKKPPTLNGAKVTDEMQTLSPHRDPFDDAITLDRATKGNAPTSVLMGPSTSNAANVPAFDMNFARASSSTPTTLTPIRPAPQRSQPAFTMPSTSRSPNNTPLVVQNDGFPNVRDAANRLGGHVITAKPSPGIALTPQSIAASIINPPPHKSSAPVVGHGSALVNELHRRIGSDTVRLRPQAHTEETPLYVHSQMNTMKSAVNHRPSGFDPFEVSAIVKNIVAKDRYSEVLEKRGFQLAPVEMNSALRASPPVVLRPHASSTPQLGSNQVLLPTPAPSSARLTMPPQYLPQMQNAVPPVIPASSVSQPRLNVASTISPRATTPSMMVAPAQIARPVSQVLLPTPAPVPVAVAKPSVALQPTPLHQVQQPQQRAVINSDRGVSTVPPQATNSSGIQQASKVALPPQTSAPPASTSAVTSSLPPEPVVIISREGKSTTDSGIKANTSEESMNQRASQQLDIASLLPAPSALFYGGSVPLNTPVNNQISSAKNSCTTSNAQVIPTAPLAQPSSSVVNMRAAPSLAASSTRVSVDLPREALIPTPLYPTLASIASPTPANQEPINPYPSFDAIMAQVAQSQQQVTPYAVPLFSAQNSLGGMTPFAASMMVPSYGGYNSYGMNIMYTPNRLPTPALPMPRVPLQPAEPRPTSTIIHSSEVISSFDPLNVPEPVNNASTPAAVAPTADVSVTKAEQMEILYKEASFADRSRCDRMVGLCNGNVEEALKKLKIEYLVDTRIAADRVTALSALEARGWNLNAAAEAIIQ